MHYFYDYLSIFDKYKLAKALENDGGNTNATHNLS